MSRQALPSPAPRDAERGGIAILLALVLLSLMGVMTFSMGRDSLREVAISGNETLGRKAAEAADGGIDWSVMWSLGGGTTTDQTAISTAVTNLTLAIADPTLRIQGADATANTQGGGTMSNTGNGVLRSYIYPSAGSTDLTVQNTGYTQSSQVLQGIELEVRYLGPLPEANTGAITSGKTGGGGSSTSKRFFFLIRSLGRANVYTASDFSGNPVQSFIARRDAIIEF